MYPTKEQLHGIPYQIAECYGKPHILAKYTARDNVNRYAHDDDVCPLCHMELITNTHHQPDRNFFPLDTPMGHFKLKPALFGLCGSGVTGCHGLIEANKLKVRWEWYEPEYKEAWWSGYTLSHGFMFNDDRLYLQGCWHFTGVKDFYWRGDMLRDSITKLPLEDPKAWAYDPDRCCSECKWAMEQCPCGCGWMWCGQDGHWTTLEDYCDEWGHV